MPDIKIEKKEEFDFSAAILKAYDLGREKGFNEGYQAGLQYAIEKAKEHLTPKGEDNNKERR